MTRFHLLALTMLVLSTKVGAAQRQVVWDLESLFKTPKVHKTEERPAKGLRSFFYEGAIYKGEPTRVFAYYATPDGDPPQGGWPAVICAHGGGGTAYPEWVRFWNGRGYAALAMDLEGHLPGGKAHQVEGNFPVGQGHENRAPVGSTGSETGLYRTRSNGSITPSQMSSGPIRFCEPSRLSTQRRSD